MKNWIRSTVLTMGVMASGSAMAAEECGNVTIADMNWSSATLIAHIDQFILTEGYGCNAELVPGDTMPSGTSMVEKGEPDIAPEFWTNNFAAALASGIEEKRLRIAGDALLDGGEEGFWIPEYLVKKNPELATISGIIANGEIFKHPEDPDKFAFMTCPAGWGCQVTNGNLYRALNLEEANFDLVDPGSGAGLAGAIARAYEREQAWFGYYWAPTAVLGKYKMVKVDFESGVDEDHFSSCLTQQDCAEPKASMYPPSPVKTLTTEDFANRVPEAYAYLSKRGFKNAQMNVLLAWMEDEQADGEIGMVHFIQNYEDTWMPWVSAEAAEKIKKAASNL